MKPLAFTVVSALLFSTAVLLRGIARRAGSITTVQSNDLPLRVGIEYWIALTLPDIAAAKPVEEELDE